MDAIGQVASYWTRWEIDRGLRLSREDQERLDRERAERERARQDLALAQMRAAERARIQAVVHEFMSTVPEGRVIDMGGPRDTWIEWTPEMQAQEFGLI